MSTHEPTVQDVLDVLQVFSTNVDRQFKTIEQKLAEHDEQFKRIDERFEQVDGRFERIDECLDRITGRVTQVENTMVTKTYFDERLHDLSSNLMAFVRPTSAKTFH